MYITICGSVQTREGYLMRIIFMGRGGFTGLMEAGCRLIGGYTSSISHSGQCGRADCPVRFIPPGGSSQASTGPLTLETRWLPCITCTSTSADTNRPAG